MARRLVGWALVALGVVVVWICATASTAVHVYYPGYGNIPHVNQTIHSESLAHERTVWTAVGALMTLSGVIMLATAPRADDQTRRKLAMLILVAGLLAAAFVGQPVFGAIVAGVILIAAVVGRRRAVPPDHLRTDTDPVADPPATRPRTER
jgi:uncharacterized membrane protein